MPSRLPPNEPAPLKRGATPGQQRRYRQALHAWYVGNALREYDHSRSARGVSIIDDICLLPSPRFDGLGGGRKYAEDGTPRTMDEVCAAIDRQARIITPVGEAYLRLATEKPAVAQAAWRRHVHLLSVDEIATAQNVSTRTVIRMLGVANLYLMAALSSATSERGKTGRELVKQSERLHHAPLPAEQDALSDEALSLAGVEEPPVESKGTR